MSDTKAAIYARFIDRSQGTVIDSIPLQNHITINIDMRQLTDSFDFDIAYRFSDKIDLHSHDFVEFYTKVDGIEFIIMAGFVEDFVRTTTQNSRRFQANGRNFLGQLFNIPFLSAKAYDQTNMRTFLASCLKDTYLPEYLDFKNMDRKIVAQGGYGGKLLIPELSDAMRAPVLQQTADEVFNLVYQNRYGQAVIWGRAALDRNDTGITLVEGKDQNVNSMSVREHYSKVYSEAKVFYTGAEGNLDYASTPSKSIFNSEKKARQIFQPLVRNFQNGTLITYSGEVSVNDAKDNLAASLIRKSNQNLKQVVVKTSSTFYTKSDGSKLPYEVNTLWGIRTYDGDIDETMRLVGIGYTQDESNIQGELLFVGKDTLI